MITANVSAERMAEGEASVPTKSMRSNKQSTNHLSRLSVFKH